jgi:hypothetical protein
MIFISLTPHLRQRRAALCYPNTSPPSSDNDAALNFRPRDARSQYTLSVSFAIAAGCAFDEGARAFDEHHLGISACEARSGGHRVRKSSTGA